MSHSSLNHHEIRAGARSYLTGSLSELVIDQSLPYNMNVRRLVILGAAVLSMASFGHAFGIQDNALDRRSLLQTLSIVPWIPVATAHAAEFTPGGTLVDRQVGVQVGNPQASPSRKPDNSNVLFDKDHYFKFGVAAPWIAPGSTDFPKTMPFTPSQQRYDALKKYGSRVQAGVAQMLQLPDNDHILSPDAPEYMLRPMGLLANAFLASENTGTTNELFLARWYINEMYLQIGDIQRAATKEEALEKVGYLKQAINSYYTLMNRVLTAKVGDKFEYV